MCLRVEGEQRKQINQRTLKSWYSRFAIQSYPKTQVISLKILFQLTLKLLILLLIISNTYRKYPLLTIGYYNTLIKLPSNSKIPVY